MKITPIASSSSGCCYVIDHNDEKLLIDCGIPLSRIRKALNHDLSNVVGCLVSHEHGDHANYLPNLEKETNIKIWCSEGVKTRFGLKTSRDIDHKSFFRPGGDFEVVPVKLNHDVECFGFLIKHHEQRLFYATDTADVNYRFPGLNKLIIECNYSFEKLIESGLNKPVVKRICETHLGIDEVIEFVKNHPGLDEIHLAHLSGGHSDEKLFKETIQDISGALVLVAKE
jgi:phosphoribosyl 1,2-cyclic phosphodiesterase